VKPLLVYYGDCGFCRRWVARWKSLTGDRVDYAPYQQVAAQFPAVAPHRFAEAAQLIEPDGQVLSGAQAVFKTLSYAPGRGWLLWAYRHMPGAAAVSEAAYRFVARHRRGASVLTRLLWGGDLQPPSYYLSRWLFLRLLGAVYLIAFVSLWVQLPGLIGHNGILPATNLLRAAAERLGPQRYHLLPTLCWLSADDGFLRFLCGGGVILSLAVFFGLAQAPALLLLWAFYLSLVTVGGDFLAFQWDILLLETGLLAVFFAPLRIRPNLARERPPPAIVLFLVRWLLFRLMFLSGAVKLASGDAAWRRWIALNFHYETQPLPTWPGWYAHQLPEWFQKSSVSVMFFIELVVPFLIFAPRRLRFLACAALVWLQALIAATGNYCFFNLLTVVLCVPLLDDAFLKRFLPGRLGAFPAAWSLKIRRSLWKRCLAAPFAVVLVAVSSLLGASRIGLVRDVPDFARPVLGWVTPFRSINSYGLFAVMTVSRPEIIVEGSRDGRTWVEYEFRWKPGNLKRRPAFVAPHQPRLDWQMWFAALGSYRHNPWFINFLQRLLEGSPEVLALLEKNPFPGQPPRYVRAILYRYHFTDRTTRREGGYWWRRQPLGLYCPVISLRKPEPRAAVPQSPSPLL